MGRGWDSVEARGCVGRSRAGVSRLVMIGMAGQSWVFEVVVDVCVLVGEAQRPARNEEGSATCPAELR